MALRPKLLPLLTWQLGDGGTCTVFAQPWFQDATLLVPPSRADRHIKVNELLDESGNWDIEEIVRLLGYRASIIILATVRPPVSTGRQDRLVFTLAKDGSFSVKKAYAILKQGTAPSLVPIQAQTDLWKSIWAIPNVQPRVRLFLWKILHEGLPLHQTLVSRIARGDPICAVCAESEESMTHMLFHCPFARSCWFTCPTPIMSSQLPPQVSVIITDILLTAPKEIQGQIVNTMWAVWRCRNDCTYGGKTPTKAAFSTYLNNINTETWLAAKQVPKTPSQIQYQPQQDEGVFDFSCFLDGAWTETWQGGVGFLFIRQGLLQGYHSEGVVTCCAIQTEALALLKAIQYAKQRGFHSVQFHSDCEELVSACKEMSPPIHSDWRAFGEIYKAWMEIQMNKNFGITYVSRSLNEQADALAKKGRQEGQTWSCTGSTFPFFPFS